MRPVSEVVVNDCSAWPEIDAFITAAPYPIEVLPNETSRATSCLHGLQVTTTSWLGAVVYYSAGILIDHAWPRVFGSGDHEPFPVRADHAE